MATEENSLVARPDGQITVFVEDANMGFEEGDARDRALPRVIILQPNSPAVARGEMKAGTYFNVITKKNYGPTLRVVPVLKQPQRLLKEKLEDGSRRPVCRSADGKTGEGTPGGDCKKCEKSRWHGQVKPECSEMSTYPWLVEGDETPSSFAFASTALESGRQLYQAALLRTPRRPMFRAFIELGTQMITKGAYTWHIPTVKFLSEAPKPMGDRASELFQALQGIRIAVENPQEDEPAGEAPSGHSEGSSLSDGEGLGPEDDIPF